MKILLTGVRGYVGGVLARAFDQTGWEVLLPDPTWRMPSALPESLLAQADVVVHAAWSMRQQPSHGPSESTNIRGSESIVRNYAGRLIFISSLSAFAGCRSTYGREKLVVERLVLDHGGTVVRPGLVHGVESGGVAGKLHTLASRLPVIPLPCANARQYLIHESDLAAFCIALASGRHASGLYSLAHPQPWTFLNLVREIARQSGHHPLIIPLPWQLAWMCLTLGEMLNLRLPLSSDNLLGLALANTSPDFGPMERCNFHPAPFAAGSHPAREPRPPQTR